MPNDDKPKNPHFENDMRYTLEMCRWYLKPMGLWCMVYDDTSTREKIVSAALILWYSFVTLFCTIPPLLELSEQKILRNIKLLCMVSTCFSAAIKFCLICRKRKPLRDCIMQVERDWKVVEDPGHRATMLKQVSISRYLIAISATIFYASGLILHIVIPVVVKITTFKGNVTHKPAALLGYDSLLNSEFSHANELITVIQLFSGLIKFTMTSCAYSLTTTFIAHIIGLIQTQISQLDYYVTDLQVKHRDSLGIIIRDHAAVLRFSRSMEESMYEIYLVQITEATLLICAIAYLFLMEWEDKIAIVLGTHVLMLISYTLNIFTFCYVGEILIEQFSQIGPVVYNIEWYNLPPKQAYNLIMLCVISLYPPKLTAGKMIPLSMNTFSSVMQTAAVYMNLLRNVSDW